MQALHRVGRPGQKHCGTGLVLAATSDTAALQSLLLDPKCVVQGTLAKDEAAALAPLLLAELVWRQSFHLRPLDVDGIFKEIVSKTFWSTCQKLNPTAGNTVAEVHCTVTDALTFLTGSDHLWPALQFDGTTFTPTHVGKLAAQYHLSMDAVSALCVLSSQDKPAMDALISTMAETCELHRAAIYRKVDRQPLSALSAKLQVTLPGFKLPHLSSSRASFVSNCKSKAALLVMALASHQPLGELALDGEALRGIAIHLLSAWEKILALTPSNGASEQMSMLQNALSRGVAMIDASNHIQPDEAADLMPTETEGGARVVPQNLCTAPTNNLLPDHFNPHNILLSDVLGNIEFQRMLRNRSKGDLPKRWSTAAFLQWLRCKRPDKEDSLKVASALGVAFEAFMKLKVDDIFGKDVFTKDDCYAHKDLKPGAKSPTGLGGEIKNCLTESIIERSKGHKTLSRGLFYNYTGEPLTDRTIGEADLARRCQVHQILMTYDPSQHHNSIKWPIFVTNTPAQLQNYASKISGAAGESGAFAIKSKVILKDAAHEAHYHSTMPTSDAGQLATLFMKEGDYASVLGYITSGDQDATVPAYVDPCICQKCQRIFANHLAVGKHRTHPYPCSAKE